jgi:hypothetical protein
VVTISTFHEGFIWTKISRKRCNHVYHYSSNGLLMCRVDDVSFLSSFLSNIKRSTFTVHGTAGDDDDDDYDDDCLIVSQNEQCNFA